LLARKLRRAVQWTEYRTDQHVGNSHGNERTFLDIEVAVRSDGTLLGLRARMLDDAGAYARYEPLGCIIWAQVLPGVFRWRNLHIEFTQAVTNKSPVGPNRGYSRQQHNWFCERVLELVAHELGLDPIELRRRNYIRAADMPYETPNGCVYDSGDYEACMDLALDLVDHEEWKAERERSGRLLGIGIGSTLDSGTNNFGQSRLLNPELQFSGNSEAATIKLDTFGEIVLTLGTTPQGQGHETTAAQVVADILAVGPEQVHVRAGHDTYWNSHGAFSGTYASQFAVTGLGAVMGATEALAAQIRELAGLVLGASPDDVVLENGQARLKTNADAALPFSALGGIVNAGNAGIPNTLTLNCRHVYVPPFQVPDLDRRFGNLCLTYAFACHACVVELDPDTGETTILDYAAVHDCGTQIHPQIIEGQLHGGLAQALGAALWETFAYDEEGQLLTANFYDYHVPHALDMPAIKTGHIESPSPFTPLGAKGAGEGGGSATLTLTSAIQDALHHAGGGTVTTSHNPPERVWTLLHQPRQTPISVELVR
jgi:2-furoyl-CoA dehydrogenase large subunit